MQCAVTSRMDGCERPHLPRACIDGGVGRGFAHELRDGLPCAGKQRSLSLVFVLAMPARGGLTDTAHLRMLT